MILGVPSIFKVVVRKNPVTIAKWCDKFRFNLYLLSFK